MTTLPALPSNLTTNTVASAAKLAVPTLPPFPPVPNISQFIDPQVSAQFQKVLQASQQFNVASQTSLALIEQAIPEAKVDELLTQFTLPDGTVDFSGLEEQLNGQYNQLTDTYDKVIQDTEVPSGTVAGLLVDLLPDVPVPTVPSPAEIRSHIDSIIEKKKRLQQEAIRETQLEAAKAEETPFTARKNAQEEQMVENTCITTESSRDLQLAITKAEIKLRRLQKCAGTRQILSQKEENGVFTVTVKVG